MSEDTPKVKRTGKRPPTKRKSEEERTEIRDTVVQLFGRAPLKEDPPMDPDGIRPVSPVDGKRKGKKRVSVGAKMADIQARIDDGTVTMKEFVATLSPEELIRGQLKAHDGTFKGRPPKWVPNEFYQACIRELLNRGELLWREAFLDSIRVFSEIAADPAVEPAQRLKAAQYVVERVAGKVPDKVELSAVEPWEQIIGGIVAEAEDDAIARASRVLNGE